MKAGGSEIRRQFEASLVPALRLRRPSEPVGRSSHQKGGVRVAGVAGEVVVQLVQRCFSVFPPQIGRYLLQPRLSQRPLRPKARPRALKSVRLAVVGRIGQALNHAYPVFSEGGEP